MSFKFAWFVELLQDLDATRSRKALASSRLANPDHQVVTQWFLKYGHKIVRQGRPGVAFLSCMFPERCLQRSYNLQEKRLSAVFGRALGLGYSRARRLNAWRDKDGHDFATCVESLMAECEFEPVASREDVTLEEIDSVLLQIASNSPYSSPEIRATANDKRADDLLGPILRRLRSFQAKWLVRLLLLRSFSPVQIPEHVAMQHFHFLLPDILSIQDSTEAAVAFLSKPEMCGLPPNPPKEYAKALIVLVAKDLVPQLGVMINRQAFDKAHSIKNCSQIAGQRLMSVERKYDGEYCQIHIDMSKGADCIQIFSKSGKDSTRDRVRLQSALRDSLRLDTEGCMIKQKCILEGELLVWSRSKCAIEPFNKIRRHVMHGGRYLGADSDSPPAVDENLMIMFFDILLLDDQVFTNEPHSKRRQHLKGLLKRIPGTAEICERELINFRSRRAPEQLRIAFARCILQRWEGFVLKGSDDPYFSWKNGTRFIKLKKDYITGLGDTADLCIVGGRREARVEQELGLGSLSWTLFYVACIDNRNDVQRFNANPVFRIIDSIGHHCISREDILDLNRKGQFSQVPFAGAGRGMKVKIENTRLTKPTDLFREPFVVEIYGAGFDKPSGCSFYSLRFPRTKSIKLHTDRTIVDTMTFDELQVMARRTMAAPPSLESQDDSTWIERLLEADGRSEYMVDKSQSMTPMRTPHSAATISISPRVRSKSKLPFVVRTDGQELASDIVVNGILSQSTSAFGTFPMLSSATSSKRRSADSGISLTPNLASKRTRLDYRSKKLRNLEAATNNSSSPERSCPPQLSCARCISSTSRNIVARRPCALIRTPPCCKPGKHLVIEPTQPFEPPAMFHGQSVKGPAKAVCPTQKPNRVSPGKRKPLTDLPNISPELSRRSLPVARAAVIVQEVDNGNFVHTTKLETLRNTVPLLQRRADGHSSLQRQAFSLTPPTSSAEAIKRRPTKTDYTTTSPCSPSDTRATKHHNVEVPAPSSVESDAVSKICNTKLKEDMQFFLLSSSIAGTSAPIDPLREVLHRMEASFTYSTNFFVEQLLRQPAQRQTVLVDISRPEAVAREILDIGLIALRSFASTTIPTRMKLFFVDYRFLQHYKPNTSPNLECERAHFCSCLEFSSSLVDARGRYMAKVLWSWEEAMA